MFTFRLQRLLREAPVTTGCVAVCTVLLLLTTKPRQTDAEHRVALDRCGAVVDRPFNPVDVKSLLSPRELRGPIALWEGQLWRIPVCAFHHVDLFHLAVNSLSAIALGWLLEPRWGSRRMLQFLMPAAILPMIPEFLAGNYVLGFSGVVAAMFGALCVLRETDDELADEFPIEAVYLGGMMLAVGVVVTLLQLAPVANLAHMTGFFYGAIAASVTTGWPWGFRIARLVRFAAVLLAAVGLYLVSHPVWDGDFHWYLALRTNDSDRRYAELQQAAALKPQSLGIWRNLAAEELLRGEPMAAWKTLLVGLSHNPTNPQFLAHARRSWREVVIFPGRQEAERVLREVFGDLAETWAAQFRADPLDLEHAPLQWPPAVAEIDPVRLYPLDQQLDLRLPDAEHAIQPPMRIPPEGDAVEGRRM